MDNKLIERISGGDNLPTDVAQMGKQLVSAGMKHGEKFGNALSDIIDKIIDSLIK